MNWFRQPRKKITIRINNLDFQYGDNKVIHGDLDVATPKRGYGIYWAFRLWEKHIASMS